MLGPSSIIDRRGQPRFSYNNAPGAANWQWRMNKHEAWQGVEFRDVSMAGLAIIVGQCEKAPDVGDEFELYCQETNAHIQCHVARTANWTGDGNTLIGGWIISKNLDDDHLCL